MRGSKTTAIDPARKITKILKKEGLHNISYGIIVSVQKRRDHRISIKLSYESGAQLLSITGKRYKQELRIYDDISREKILQILKNRLGETFRIL